MAKRVKPGVGEAVGYPFIGRSLPADTRMAEPPAPPEPNDARPEVAGDAPAAEPHHVGHRDRLRQRFAQAGHAALADYELVELILFRSIPRRDVKPLAKALIARFGGLPEIAGASLERLMEVEGIGHATALDLRIVSAFNQRAVRAAERGRDMISSSRELMQYLQADMAFLPREHFRILYLDNRNGLIRDEIQHAGTANFTPVTTREIIRRALELDAVSMVLCHNHPSGDVTPSMADIEKTQEILEMARAVQLRVHDHVIVGRGNAYSMRQESRLKSLFG